MIRWRAWFLGGVVALGTSGALPTGAGAQSAKAELKDKDGKAAGLVTIAGTASGVLLTIKAEGLEPGPHALRFHETGACDGDFSSAGAIYNPLGAKHGLLSEEGPMAGDLPNIIAAKDGVAEAELLSPFVHLGKDDEATLLDEDGTAVLIFGAGDDHITDPDGGAGSPVLCGILKGD